MLGTWVRAQGLSNLFGSLQAVTPGASVTAFTDKSGRGVPRPTCTLSRSFPEPSGSISVLPGGSLPQKAGTSQEGVKWSEERGESFQVPSVDRWACCPATTTQSYVRNEPASLQLCPGDSGVTQTDCRLPGGCFVCASCVGFCWAPDWRLAPAQGDRGQVSRWLAAGRPASGGCPCLAPVS